MAREKTYLYGEEILGIGGKKNKERNYNKLGSILCHRFDLAKHLVYEAFQEQVSGCKSCILLSNINVPPHEIS